MTSLITSSSDNCSLQEVSYGKKNVDAYVKYSETNHGSDGALFLDRYFMPAIENLSGKKVLDIGCGAAPWSIYAAKHGGNVHGFDIQPEMIEAARRKVIAAGVQDQVELSVGDASDMAYDDDFFDREISICVGCNLPEGVFENSFKEMARTLKADGIAVVGAPYSLDTVFTDDSKSPEKVRSHIEFVLNSLPSNPSQEAITSSLSDLTEVLSATFHVKDGKLTLVTDVKALKEGEKIWRKLPKPIVPNRYHSLEAYLRSFADNQLKVTSIETPHFTDEAERLRYNASVTPDARLGAEYVSQPPFVIFHVTKE